MKDYYLVTLLDLKTQELKTIIAYSYFELQYLINYYPCWKYKLTIIQADSLQNVSEILNSLELQNPEDEKDDDFNNPFSNN